MTKKQEVRENKSAPVVDYKAELDAARIRISELEVALQKIRHLGEYGSVGQKEEIHKITAEVLGDKK